ncbi:hypothetical protein CI594_17200, partial [Fischerella thermalis CCMEE 5196]
IDHRQVRQKSANFVFLFSNYRLPIPLNRNRATFLSTTKNPDELYGEFFKVVVVQIPNFLKKSGNYDLS